MSNRPMTGAYAPNPHEGSRSEILADYLFSSWGTVSDVVHHLLGAGEGRLGVDDPFRMAHGIEMPAENLRVSKGLERREELEFADIAGPPRQILLRCQNKRTGILLSGPVQI
jgi:hypothetical protein